MKNKQSWIDQRFPLTKVWNEHLAEYYTPRNFNFWYFFGSLAILMLVMQLVTGIFLTMHFKPDSANAFASVEYIMRDVEWGWLVRYLHSVGASAFFVVIYLHMYRGLLYGSYKGPRELIWVLGMLLYIALMAEAFMGYVLPWGQMSYWGAQVIISLFGSVPVIGPDLLVWILGDYAVGDAALNRFFSLHVIALPLILVVLVFLHIVALHTVGSNNPDGIEIKKTKTRTVFPRTVFRSTLISPLKTLWVLSHFCGSFVRWFSTPRPLTATFLSTQILSRPTPFKRRNTLRHYGT